MKRLLHAHGKRDSFSGSTPSSPTLSAPEGHSLSRKSTSGDSSTQANSSSSESAHASALAALQAARPSSDPEEFVAQAIIPIFSFNPKHDPLNVEDLVLYHVPKYFSPEYKHQTNTWEMGLSGWLARMAALRDVHGLVLPDARCRSQADTGVLAAFPLPAILIPRGAAVSIGCTLEQNLKKSRFRLIKSTIDQSERQSMQRACVLISYEVVLSGPQLPEDDVRMPGVGIFDIKEGKLVSGKIVIDLSPSRHQGPDLNCTVS